MAHDFFDPSPEDMNIVLLSVCQLELAQTLIESCEHCNPDAEIPFDWVLDGISGMDPGVTDYVLERPARCCACSAEVLEKTLVACE